MIAALIERCVRERGVVLLLAALLLGTGLWAVRETPVDALPDLSDVQVILFTDHAGQSPQVVEDQVTYPLTTAMLSVPGARAVRGYSFFGFSMIYVIFEDGTDLYWARARVLESLSSASRRLPPGVTPELGPDATGVGWIYMYSLRSDRHDLSELRTLQDWYLRYELMSLKGVSEVASVGGYVRQYQVEVDPEKLRAYRVSLRQVHDAVREANADVGGRLLEMAETEYMVRGRGYIQRIEDLEQAVVAVDAERHTPIFLSQIARVQLGPEIRRGIVELNGEGEVVSGIVVMRSGENALQVIDRVKARLAELEAGLPEGVEIVTSYDRSTLIGRAIDALRDKLGQEMLIVALICALFLLHLRSALVAVLVVPLGILLAFICMRLLGLGADIMSLGGLAIAIGVMVDASIVMVENLHKHRERAVAEGHNPGQETLVLRAAKEVGPALFFSLLVVTVSFLPVFTLEQQEGRLFTPLATTKTLAMAGASLLAITVIPALMFYVVRGRTVPEAKHPVSRLCIALYRPLLRGALAAPWLVVVLAIALAVSTLWPLRQLGREFMPPLNEGDLLYMPTTPPGISITKARELLQQTDKLIARHPQVAQVLGKAGRAETATDPAPLSMLESTITLTPKDTWPAGKTIEDVIAELDEMVRFPGLTNSWTMPIKTRLDMLATGIKTPVGIKLLGDDLAQLSELGETLEARLRGRDGVKSVYSERVMGGHYVDISVRRADAARFGLSVADVQAVISSAIGGTRVTQTIEGLERYPVNLRFPRELRDDLSRLERVPVTTPMGHTVPLVQVADIGVTEGPAAIKSENARRTVFIYVDLDTTDLGGWVEAARRDLAAEVELPAGVSIQWSGEFESLERAEARLSLVVPLTLALIFLLLFMHFRNATQSLMVMLTLPFALVGGIWLLYGLQFNLSVAVVVGFLALAGLAAETGVVMLVYLDQAVASYRAQGRLQSETDLKAAIYEGAALRLRPKLMTVATDLLALLPIMFGSETGTRIMKRIATPMVGGVLTSALLTLVILPALYLIWQRASLRRTLQED